MVFPSFMFGLDQRKFIVLAVLAGVSTAVTFFSATGAAICPPPKICVALITVLLDALAAWSMIYWGGFWETTGAATTGAATTGAATTGAEITGAATTVAAGATYGLLL